MLKAKPDVEALKPYVAPLEGRREMLRSRVPPGRAEEREALREIAHLAEELREEREGAPAEGAASGCGEG